MFAGTPRISRKRKSPKNAAKNRRRGKCDLPVVIGQSANRVAKSASSQELTSHFFDHRMIALGGGTNSFQKVRP